MDEADIRTWYMMVVGLAEPFLHGQFIFKFRVPEEFPMRPP
jgi:ubiquitin-protein ligase